MIGNPDEKHISTSLKTTLAIKAGVASHVWTVDEMVNLLAAVEPKSTRAAKISN